MSSVTYSCTERHWPGAAGNQAGSAPKQDRHPKIVVGCDVSLSHDPFPHPRAFGGRGMNRHVISALFALLAFLDWNIVAKVWECLKGPRIFE
eukprot:523033-Amorphochlora_amoeboformis.AAC.2